MPITLDGAITERVNEVTGKTEVLRSAARAAFTTIEGAVNANETAIAAARAYSETLVAALSGTVSFDPANALFATKAAAQAANVGSQNFIGVLGQTAAGDSPIAWYTPSGSAAINDGASFEADSAHWHLVENNDVTEAHFGSVGDGTTDDTTAFQNWIDFANAKDKTNAARNMVLEPQGARIRLTKPIWLARGLGFNGPNPLRGKRDMGRSRDEGSRGGTVLIKDFQGGILLIVHAARDFEISGLAFDNPNYGIVAHFDNDMRKVRDPAEWELLRAHHSTNAENYIAVDPFFGSAPASNGYVAGTGAGEIPLPSWVNQTLYNTRLQTSGGNITGCYFENSPHEAISIQGNREANSDFIDIKGNHIDGCRNLVAQRSSQSRGMNIDNNKGGTFLDLADFSQSGADGVAGRLNGTLGYNSVNKCRSLVKFADTAVGSAGSHLVGNYIETGTQYVLIDGGGGGETYLRISDAQLNVDPNERFSGGPDQPGYVIKGSTGARIEVDGWSYSSNTEAVQVFEPKHTRVKNAAVNPRVLASSGLTENEFLRIGMSACLGLYFNIGAAQGLGPHDVRAKGFDEATDDPVTNFGWASTFDNDNTTRSRLLPLWQWEYKLASQRLGRTFQKQMNETQSVRPVQSSSPTNTQVKVTFGTGRVDTFLLGDEWADDHHAENNGAAAGDGIFDPETGTVWFIFSRVVAGTSPNRTATLLAYRMSNYQETSEGIFGDFDQIIFNGAGLTQNQGAWAAGSNSAGDTVQSSSDGRWYQTAGGGTAAGGDIDLDGGSDTGISDWTQVRGPASLYFVNHRMFAVDRYLTFDATSGSSSITVKSPRLNSADIAALNNATTGIQVGDRFFDHAEQSALFVGDANRIVSITDNSDGTGTVVMAGNAARTVTGADFVQFVRTPPANVATP